METHSDQTLNTSKYPQYCQILGIANITHLYSQYREISLATMWECIRCMHRRMLHVPLATLNTQITCTRHETAAKDGDHRPFCLRACINCVYSSKSHQNTNIPATTVGNPNTAKYPGIWPYLGCQHQILNTVKYRQILYWNLGLNNWNGDICHTVTLEILYRHILLLFHA